MAETPVSYLPDYFTQIMPEDHEDHATEILMARSGVEQRRPLFRSTGYRRIIAVSSQLSQADRFALRTFLTSHRGRLTPFYAWSPIAELKEDFACGSVSSASKIVVPARITGPIGGGLPLGLAVGAITEIRVAGVSKLFTRRSLLPRPGLYAALYFSGSSGQYIDCASSATLRGVGDMTVTAWVNGFSFAAPRTIVSNRTLNASGIIAYIQSDGTFRLATNFASSNTEGVSSFTVTADTLTHIAVTRTSGGPAIFYKNGVAFNTTASLTNPATATISFKVGGEAAANPFLGTMNSVRLYDSALSAAEILNIYNGTPSPSANLRGMWRLNDGTGLTAVDISGYGNNGTLTGSTLPAWASGEEEITFTAGAQTGAVTLWGTVRERMLMRYDSDSIAEAFSRTSPGAPLAIISLPLKEVV